MSSEGPYKPVGIREASEKAEVEKGTMPLCAGCSAYVSIASAQARAELRICKHCDWILAQA